MFIKQLYHYNKYWLAAFVCFIVFFLYINYKWGVVATPVYQYGMFSGQYSLADTNTVLKIYVDDKELAPGKMHFSKKDMLFTMAEKYAYTDRNPLVVYETMKSVFGKTGLGKMVEPSLYKSVDSHQAFAQWLLRYSKFTGSRLHSVEQQFLWKDDALTPISSPQPIVIATF